MQINDFLEKLSSQPEQVSFEDTISTIDENYEFTPTEFKNGDLVNQANQNNGSCKIFAFCKLQNINASLALHCFGNYYQKDVLQHPDADDHQNIRNFMQSGWDGISFSAQALKSKD